MEMASGATCLSVRDMLPGRSRLATRVAASAATSSRCPWWPALSRLCFTLYLLTLACSARAAIGIYNWYPEQADPYGVIHYRLNADAVSGSITIRSSTGWPVRVIGLPPQDLTKGPHTVTWYGDQDSGGIAPTGDYRAEITVTAAPEPAGSPRRDFANIAAKYYGVAVDADPANNNQIDPHLSTYGMIFACDTVGGRIEVFYPDQWQTGLAPGQQATPAKVIDVSGRLGGAQPWGVGVDGDGRVVTTVRQFGQWQGFHSFSIGSEASAFGREASPAQDIAAFGSTSAAGSYQLRSSGSSVQMARMNPDFTYFDYLPADAAKVASPVISDAGAPVFGVAAAPGAAFPPPLWTTTFGTSASVRKWISDGGSYTSDASWSVQPHAKAPANTAVGVDISRANPATMAVGCQRASDNIVFLNSVTGAYLSSVTAAPSMVHSVRFDGVGNLFFDGGGSTRFHPQTLVSALYLPDSGSTDTRTTIPFRHTRNNLPPQILQMSFAPPSVPGGGSASTALELRVKDPNGLRDIDTVVADLSALGFQGWTPLVQHQVVDLQTAVYRLSSIKAARTAPVGLVPVTVRVRDFFGVQVNGAANLQVTGATVTGLVTHEQLGVPVGGASVVFTETTTGRTCSATTAAGGADAGRYSAEVGAGSYTVSAVKPGYGHGGDDIRVTVAAGQTLADIDPTLSSMTSSEFKAAEDSSFVSVAVVVAARPAAEDWASGGAKGWSDNTVASRARKWMLYDHAGEEPARGGVKISDDLYKPEQGSLVVVEGVKRSGPGIEPYVEQISALHDLGPGPALQPETRTLASLDRGGDIEASPDWGRYVRIGQAAVVSGSQTDPGGSYLSYNITDPSTQLMWTVKVWKSLGVSLADLPGDGVEMPVTGFVAPDGYFLPNVIEPATAAEAVQPYIDIPSVGNTGALKDLTKIRLTEPHFVTIVQPAEHRFFIESPDQVAALQVESSGALPVVGQLVKVSGQIKTNEKSERVIGNSSYTIHGAAHARPWNMGVKATGGAGYISAYGAPAPVGLSTHGLLVRVLGRVTLSVPARDLIVVDDGSMLESGEGAPGIKVLRPGAFPGVGTLVSVVGVVDSEPGPGGKLRVLLGRAGTDPDPAYKDLIVINP